MGRLNERLRRAEREAEGLWQVLTLSDGTRVKYEPEEMVDAIVAVIDGEDHHLLLPYIERMDQDRGIPSLVRALGHPAEEKTDGN